MAELNLDEERGDYQMKMYSSVWAESGDRTVTWTGKVEYKAPGYLIKEGLTRKSEENSKKYRKSRYKNQPLPNPSTEMEYPRSPFPLHPRSEIQKSLHPWLAEWQRNCCDGSPGNTPSRMQGESCWQTVSHWRQSARKQPKLGRAAGCSLLLTALHWRSCLSAGAWCWWSHPHCRRWLPRTRYALSELGFGKLWVLQEPGAGEAVHAAEAYWRSTSGTGRKIIVLQCLSITHYCQSLALSQLTKTTKKVQLHFCTVGNKEWFSNRGDKLFTGTVCKESPQLTE